MSEELPRQLEPLAPATAFELLSHSTRIGLIECLADYDETLALADAAEEVAGAVEDKPVQEIEAESVKQFYMALYHSHIPRLEAHDVVQYDQERDLVALTDRGHQLATSLHQFQNHF